MPPPARPAPARRARRVGLVLALGLAGALAAPGARAADPGACGPLPAAAAGAAGAFAAVGSGAPTVLLMLPRTAAGDLGTDALALGPGARVVASFWSPVLCATVARVTGPPGTPAEALVERLPDGAAVVPDTVYTSAAPPDGAPLPPPSADGAAAGGDPYRDLQHALGSLEVARARPVTDGRGVRVGLVDSRPAPDHPDLPPLRPGTPGTASAPSGRHGTLLAGVLAALEDNGLGIAGVAPAAELVALPACEPGAAPHEPDRCRLFDLLAAFDAAWEARTAVVNLSLVGAPNPLLERAVARLDRLGVLVVAAAGNEPTDAPRYPAAYPSVIGVGALDREGRRWADGNRSEGVEILAPGVEIVSTVPGGDFAFADGTSLAAAHVSGVLALLASASGDPAAARTALFQAGHARARAEAGAAVLPPVCDALARLGRPCPDPPGP